MNQVLGARDTNAWLAGPRGSSIKAGPGGGRLGCTPCKDGASSAWASGDSSGGGQSLLTQERSQMQTPELRQAGAAAGGVDDVSSSSRGVTPEWGGPEGAAAGQQAVQVQQAQEQQQAPAAFAPGSTPASRPASAASNAAAVDAADVRRLVTTVEALQVGGANGPPWLQPAALQLRRALLAGI